MSGSAVSYSIRDLSRDFGVTTRTLRFYEEKGLLEQLSDGILKCKTQLMEILFLIERQDQLGNAKPQEESGKEKRCLVIWGLKRSLHKTLN